MIEFVMILMLFGLLAWTLALSIGNPGETKVRSTPSTVNPAFERKAEKMFRDVKRRHPKLREEKVQLTVKPVIQNAHGRCYGQYFTVGIAGVRSHYIALSQSSIQSSVWPDKKLHDTICHEFAHMLDVLERSTSAHDDEFEERLEEIKGHAPREEII